jgi:hypothetical protein
MENLTTLKESSYWPFKTEMDREVKAHAEGFVRIGYLLKLARDTEVLKESGYANVNDFAQKEYGLSKDMVSRYIRINDRFSVDGNSDKLQERYSEFGYAKLADMLTLADNIVDAIPPEATRVQIQEIAKEVREEEKITDLEVRMEQPDPAKRELNNTLEQLLHRIFYEERWKFANLMNELNAAGCEEQAQKNVIRDVLTPAGYFMKTARIPQMGKLILSIKGENEPITITNMRATGEPPEIFSWDDLLAAVNQFSMPGKAGESIWETIYNEPFKEKSESCTGATVKKPEKTECEPKKEQKVVEQPKAEPKPEKKEPPKVPETVEKTECKDVSEEQKKEVRYPLSEKDRLWYEERAETGNFLAKRVIQKDDEWHAELEEKIVQAAVDCLITGGYRGTITEIEKRFINDYGKSGMLVRKEDCVYYLGIIDEDALPRIEVSTTEKESITLFTWPLEKITKLVALKAFEMESAEEEEEEEDEQLPGQMDVSDYPELTPDSQVQQEPEVLTGNVENTEESTDTVENWLRIETQALLKEVSENNWMSAISISQLITEFLQKTMKDRIEGVTNE